MSSFRCGVSGAAATVRGVEFWRSDTWQWWLEHGFDGIGAGIIGGAVTGAAVFTTILWEKRVRSDDARASERVELRRAVAALLTTAVDLETGARQPEGKRQTGRRASVDIVVAESLAFSAGDRSLGRQLREIRRALVAEIHPDATVVGPELVAIAGQLDHLCREWLFQLPDQ